jgi:hypothetical protein
MIPGGEWRYRSEVPVTVFLEPITFGSLNPLKKSGYDL